MLFQPFEDDLSLYKVLELALADARFSSLTVVVAWAKESGLRRIRPLLSGFRNGGGTARIILGIDAGGASVEGLRNAISDLIRQQSCTTHPGPFTRSCTSSTARKHASSSSEAAI
jgi:hypothetical protein